MGVDNRKGNCSFCGQQCFNENLMEMDGRTICFPCALINSYADVVERNMSGNKSYNDALQRQRLGKATSDLWLESGIKETCNGSLYYPDEDHNNIFHIVAKKELE